MKLNGFRKCLLRKWKSNLPKEFYGGMNKLGKLLGLDPRAYIRNVAGSNPVTATLYMSR